jgi:EAL and modified HD-GYP domain-containing signal transduction protein
MVFINKQPILDADSTVSAFLIDPLSSSKHEHVENHTLFLEKLLSIGLKKFSDGKPLFIRILDELLNDTLIRDFASEGTIFAIDHIDEETYKKVGAIKKHGAKAALFIDVHSDLDLASFEALTSQCDFFILDASRHTAAELENFLFTCKRMDGSLLAINVHSQESRQQLQTYGFTLFGGSYFTIPLESDADVPQNYLSILDLLNTLEQSSSIDEIAEKFAHTPDLTFQLLKFLNSPTFGLSKSIKSIRHALMMIGRKELRRWLLLLALEASEDEGSGPSPLNLAAQERTAFMAALFAEEKALEAALQSEAAFIAVLALMDALTGLSYAKIFDTISIDGAIKNAIISYEGELGQLLELCIATEHHDIVRILALLKTLGISKESYERAVLNGYQGH